MKIDIKFPNAAIVAQSLQNLGAKIPEIGSTTIIRALVNVRNKMQVYPSPPANSRYVRTYLLRDSWRVDTNGQRFALINTAANRGREYAKYVVGSPDGQDQAWMHVGRWQLMRDVIDAEVAELNPLISKEISMVARAQGF